MSLEILSSRNFEFSRNIRDPGLAYFYFFEKNKGVDPPTPPSRSATGGHGKSEDEKNK